MSLKTKERLKLCLKVQVVLLVIWSNFLMPSKASKCPREDKSVVQSDGVCPSIDIRNEIGSFEKLENCTVIEGHLRISLIERESKEAYAKYRFPLLREITDYMLLYRVYGLTSLRDMFPNLAVIRGRVLFTNFALVVYEMIDLGDLGLINLQRIERGGVRLARNKKLCFIETVDWNRLGVPPEEQDFKHNREESQCVNLCPNKCAKTKVDGVQSERCWTSSHCQKNLSCNCDKNRTCREDGTCCHEYCLGGCDGPGVEKCFVCKDVVYDDKCMTHCPAHTFMYFDRRCLTAKECSQLNKISGQDGRPPLVLFAGEKNKPALCLQTCPVDYTAKKDKVGYLRCEKCEGLCPKECEGRIIKSIQKVQELTGCSEISGDLTIEIYGGIGNVAEEMQKGLRQIKKIRGMLMIHKSFLLLNMFFFENLEVIEGNEKGDGLRVENNDNLQELFTTKVAENLKIAGLVYITNNGKLCGNKIEDFKNMVNLSEDAIRDHTNGHNKPCKMENITVTAVKTTHEKAIVEWEQPRNGDQRRVLTYIINYKETVGNVKHEDVNIFQGKDACSEDGWMTLEKDNPEDDSENMKAVISDLKPFTTYALYIHTYTLASARYAARTDMMYFTTRPWDPSKPNNVEVSADGPNELLVKWSEPKKPNGEIDHYVVSYQPEELDRKEFNKRDYCKHPVVTSKRKKKEELDEKEKNLNHNNSNCCACPKSKDELEAEAKKQEMDIYFEDFLHGSLYCKRYNELPFELDENLESITLDELSKPGLDLGNYYETKDKNLSIKDLHGLQTFSVPVDNQKSDQTSPQDKSRTRLRPDTSKNQTVVGGPVQVIVNGTELLLSKLEHFREYSITVKACHAIDIETQQKLCSALAITQGRTIALPSFDQINTTTMEVSHVTNKSSEVIIKWGLPTNPNGLTVNFMFLYKPANQESAGWYEMCVSMQEYYKHNGYRLTGLAPGNWTYKIRPVSLGGVGIDTPERTFLIPFPPGEEKWPIETIIPIAVSFFIVLMVVIICYCYFKDRFRKEDMTVISQNINYIPSEPAYIMDDWEVDRSKIRTIREIGQGSFGMVYEGIATGLGDDPKEEIRVAVKTVNDRAGFNDRREFLKEATTMKAFDCFHVVKLLGVVSTGQPALVIMELMAQGDLKNYLREHRPDEENPDVTPPCLQDILQMAGEVADGMAYLADKKFVHRDLAARNCMVAEDRTVKIGDFGMTRDVYETDYYRKGGKGMLPVRWMAPESLKDGMFSSMSDVWSYGVVIWEMVTLAAQPYQGLSNDQVIKFITDGNTMDMPENCPEEMAYLMKRCWAKRIKLRPTFKEILAYLLPHLNPRFEKVSYYFSDGGGHTTDTGRGLGGEEEEEDDCSINSLSCEGAAAPRQSLRGGSDYGYGSPTASADSGSVYDEGMDPLVCMDNSGRGGYYPHAGDVYAGDSLGNSDLFNNGLSDLGVEMNDMNQPFIRDSFREVPRVMTRQSNGPASSPHNSGLIELQPLLSTGRTDAHPSSSRPSTVQSSLHPFTPELVDHPQLYPPPAHPHHYHPQFSSQAPAPAPAPNIDLSASHPPSQNSSPFGLADTDPLRAGPPSQHSIQPPSGRPKLEGVSNPLRLGPSDPLRSGPPVSSSKGDVAVPGPLPDLTKSSSLPPAAPLAKPTLRLPTLNQPPSGGFKRVPLYSTPSGRQEHKDNGSGYAVGPRGGHHPPVSDSSGIDPAVPASPGLVTPQIIDHHSETSPILSDSPHPSSRGAIASSSEGSKDSGSHSCVNGLSNGHIPMSTNSSNRTTPC